MLIKMHGDTFKVDESIILEELKNILYDAGRINMNSASARH